MSDALRRSQRPVIRLFGPLSIEDGGRSLGASRPGRRRDRSRCSRSCLPHVGIASDRPAGRAPVGRATSRERRRLAPDLRLGPPTAPGLRPGTCAGARRHGAGGVPLRDRSGRARPRPLRRALERSVREPTRQRSAPRSSRRWRSCAARCWKTSRMPSGHSDLRGSYQGRVLGAHLEAADAALAELDFGAALAHGEAAVALDRFSERAHSARRCWRSTRSGDQHEALRPLPHASACAARRGARPRADAGETRALEAAIIRQEDVHSLLPRPIPRAAGEHRRTRRAACSAGRTELETLAEGRCGRRSTGTLALIQIEGEAGLGKTRLLDELVGELDGCSRRTRELLGARAAPPLRAARGCAARRARRHRARRRDACRRSPRSCPSSSSTRPGREFERGRGRSRRWSLLIAEHGADRAAARRPPVGRLQRRSRLSDYLHRRGAGPCGGDRRDDSAGYHERRRTTRSAGWRPDADRPARAALTPRSSRRCGVPELYESTGGNPRFVTEALASGKRRRPVERRSPRRCSRSAAPRAAWAYRILVAASVARAAVRAGAARGHARRRTRPSSPRSSSASANGGSCASTGSASVFATTLSAQVLLGQHLAARDTPPAAAARRAAVDGPFAYRPRDRLAGRMTPMRESGERSHLRDGLRAGATSPRTSWIRQPTASSPRTTPAARMLGVHARRSCSRRRSRAIHPAELPELSELLERGPAGRARPRRSRSPAERSSGTFLPTEISLHAFEDRRPATHPRRSFRTGASTASAERRRLSRQHSFRTGGRRHARRSNAHCANGGGTDDEHHNRNRLTRQRGRVRVEHGAEAGPRLPRRRARRRHDRTATRLGEALRTRPTTSRPRTSAPSC